MQINPDEKTETTPANGSPPPKYTLSIELPSDLHFAIEAERVKHSPILNRSEAARLLLRTGAKALGHAVKEGDHG